MTATHDTIMKASEVVTLTPAAWLKARGGKAKRRANCRA